MNFSFGAAADEPPRPTQTTSEPGQQTHVDHSDILDLEGGDALTTSLRAGLKQPFNPEVLQKELSSPTVGTHTRSVVRVPPADIASRLAQGIAKLYANREATADCTVCVRMWICARARARARARVCVCLRVC